MMPKKADDTNFLRNTSLNKELPFQRKGEPKALHLLCNKKADERVLSIYLFIIYVVVAIGIVSGVILFYGSPLDVRALEAGILADKTIDCLSDKGLTRPDFFEPGFDLAKSCGFNFSENSQKYQGEEQYAVSVKISDFDSCQKQDSGLLSCSGNIKSASFGRQDFFELCGSKGSKVPVCNMKQVYLLDSGEKIILEVRSAVGKVQNVKGD